MEGTKRRHDAIMSFAQHSTHLASKVIDLTLSSEEDEPPFKRQKSTPPSHLPTHSSAKPSTTSRAPGLPRYATPVANTTNTVDNKQTLSAALPSTQDSVTAEPSSSSSVPSAKKSPFRNRPDWSRSNDAVPQIKHHEPFSTTTSRAGDPTVSIAGALPSQAKSGSVRLPSKPESLPSKLFQAKKANSPSRSQKFVIEIPSSRVPPRGQQLSHRPAQSPASSQVSVVIPSSHARPTTQVSSPADRLLEQFQRPLTAEAKYVKAAILRELEESADPIKTRLSDIERLFGPNGFSSRFSVEEDVERLKRLAAKKAKKIKRNDITLDLGPASPLHSPPESSARLLHPRIQAAQILESKFHERIASVPSLTFTNNVNDRRLGGKFQFISDYILREKVSRLKEGFNFGCSCQDHCHPLVCNCLKKDIDTNDEDAPRTDVSLQTYARRSDGLVVLCENYIDLHSRTSEITECNHLCGCGPACWNRVVQKGRTVPLDIFQTSNNTGFGVRSSQPIIRGQFIDVYLGEVITQFELEARESAKEESASSYIYSLDWWNDLGHATSHYQVDGENFGTAMRFVNHSCSPNTRTFTVQTEHHADKKLYYLAFFAVRNIAAGEEITIDYNPQMARDKDGKFTVMDGEDEEEEVDDSDSVLDDDTVRCRCGSANCRIRLWPRASQRKSKAKKVTR